MKRAEVTPKILHKAAELYVQGEKAPAIQKVTGLDHSQAAYVRYLVNYYYRDGGEVVEATGENASALYDLFDVSVGGIMTMFGPAEDGLWAYSASDIEKLYSDYTGYTLKGQRCGKGGQFLQGDRRLYEGPLQAKGTPLTPAQVRDEAARYGASVEALSIREAMDMEVQALRQDLDAFGEKYPKSATKAQLARKWAKCRAAVEAA